MTKIELPEFAQIYQDIFGEESFNTISDSYNSWIRYQEDYESKTEEERNKYKYVIWENFPEAHLWIFKKKKDYEERLQQSLAMLAYNRLPWYERILTEDGNCKIKDKSIDAIITNKQGEDIRVSLCRWDIEASELFLAIKHFIPYVTEQTVTDVQITEFLTKFKEELNYMGRGVCADGGRVLRTLKWACQLFMKEVIQQ